MLFCLVAQPLLGGNDSKSSLSRLLSLAWVYIQLKGPQSPRAALTPRAPPWTAATNAHVSLGALEIRLHFRWHWRWICLQRPISRPRSDTIWDPLGKRRELSLALTSAQHTPFCQKTKSGPGCMMAGYQFCPESKERQNCLLLLSEPYARASGHQKKQGQ